MRSLLEKKFKNKTITSITAYRHLKDKSVDKDAITKFLQSMLDKNGVSDFVMDRDTGGTEPKTTPIATPEIQHRGSILHTEIKLMIIYVIFFAIFLVTLFFGIDFINALTTRAKKYAFKKQYIPTDSALLSRTTSAGTQSNEATNSSGTSRRSKTKRSTSGTTKSSKTSNSKFSPKRLNKLSNREYWNTIQKGVENGDILIVRHKHGSKSFDTPNKALDACVKGGKITKNCEIQCDRSRGPSGTCVREADYLFCSPEEEVLVCQHHSGGHIRDDGTFDPPHFNLRRFVNSNRYEDYEDNVHYYY